MAGRPEVIVLPQKRIMGSDERAGEMRRSARRDAKLRESRSARRNAKRKGSRGAEGNRGRLGGGRNEGPGLRGFAERDEELLGRVAECIASLQGFRAERQRCKRFTFGDQWIDVVEEGGIRMSEEEFIRRQGNIPLKNNLIRRLVRNVLGVFRNRLTLPRCAARDPRERRQASTVNLLLDYNRDFNRLDEVYARTMEEFLISGLAVHKKWYGRRGRTCDCHTDLISPERFFFDTSSRDFRGSDVSIAGEVHDMAFDRLCTTFARNPEDVTGLAKAYGVNAAEARAVCRVYEVWERRHSMRLSCHDRETGKWFLTDPERYAAIARMNGRRVSQGREPMETTWIYDDVWRYSFLSPEGTVLSRGLSPYAHGGNPYVFKAYPYIDGEIHSFVSDILDQQKLTNRLISMYDWILRASAKGVLLFPEGSLPDGVDINDVADEWSRFNGVIVFRPKAGVPLPQQISSKSTDIGITELLEIQMKMMEDISGVNGALQGKLDSTTMSGTLYDQQTRNSITALADLLRSFDDFIMQATAADVSNIRQFYSPARIESVIGRRPECTVDLRETGSLVLAPYDFDYAAEEGAGEG